MISTEVMWTKVSYSTIFITEIQYDVVVNQELTVLTKLNNKREEKIKRAQSKDFNRKLMQAKVSLLGNVHVLYGSLLTPG